MKKNLKLYFTLFSSAFYISAFTIGGGFVILPLLKKRFVDELKLLNENEMLDYMAIAQSAPGVIAVNTSILIGYRIAGFLGAVATVLGTILPPLIITSIISLFYNAFKDNGVVAAVLNCMQAAVAAIIVNIVFDLGGKIALQKKIFPIFIMAAAFALVFFFNVNVLYILLGAAIFGIVNYYIMIRKNNNRLNKEKEKGQ